MLFVIDANVLFAALLNPKGMTGNLLFSPKLEFFSPEFLEEELQKYFSTMVQKSGRSEAEVKIVLDLILSRIKIFPASEYERYRTKAKDFSPDPNDVEYFALALKLECSLWSNDKRLKGQREVKVFSTSEMLTLF